MLGFNSLSGTNYLFVNRKPPGGSSLDLLGPWPWYLVAEVGVIVVVWAAMTWAWRLPAVRAGRPGDFPPPAG